MKQTTRAALACLGAAVTMTLLPTTAATYADTASCSTGSSSNANTVVLTVFTLAAGTIIASELGAFGPPNDKSSSPPPATTSLPNAGQTNTASAIDEHAKSAAPKTTAYRGTAGYPAPGQSSL